MGNACGSNMNGNDYENNFCNNGCGSNSDLILVARMLEPSNGNYKLTQCYNMTNNNLRAMNNSQVITEVIPSDGIQIMDVDITPSMNLRRRDMVNGRGYAVGELPEISQNGCQSFQVTVEFKVASNCDVWQLITSTSIQLEFLVAATVVSTIGEQIVSDGTEMGNTPTIATYTGNNLTRNVGLC